MDNLFNDIVFAMGETSDSGLDLQDIVSDQEIISGIKKLHNLEEKDFDGRTLLINAACYGRVNVVRYLLDKGCSIEVQDSAGFTALHAAVVSGSVETVKVLLEKGANPNSKNVFGNGPLMVGNLTTTPEIFEVLVANGADPTQCNQYGISAIDMFSGSPEILSALK